MFKQIINNRNIEVTPNKIYKIIIIFGIFCFFTGFISGYITIKYILYNELSNLIYNNGMLIFDDNYYRFIQVYPTINDFINI